MMEILTSNLAHPVSSDYTMSDCTMRSGSTLGYSLPVLWQLSVWTAPQSRHGSHAAVHLQASEDPS